MKLHQVLNQADLSYEIGIIVETHADCRIQFQLVNVEKLDIPTLKEAIESNLKRFCTKIELRIAGQPIRLDSPICDDDSVFQEQFPEGRVLAELFVLKNTSTNQYPIFYPDHFISNTLENFSSNLEWIARASEVVFLVDEQKYRLLDHALSDQHLRIDSQKRSCRFMNTESLLIDPKRISSANINGPLSPLFEAVHCFVLMTFLANFSSLNGSKLEIKLNGYRLHHQHLDLTNFNGTKVLDTYADLINWIYADNIDDRLEIARNVISIHCTENCSLLSVSPAVCASAKSAYEIYLKENVEKYLSVRSETITFLSQKSEAFSKAQDSLFSVLSSSLWLTFTFLISTRALELFKPDQAEKIDLTGLTYLLLGGLIIFALINLIIFYHRIQVVRKHFNSTKEHYKVILVKEDVEQLLPETESSRYLKRMWITVIVYFLVNLALITGFYFATPLGQPLP